MKAIKRFFAWTLLFLIAAVVVAFVAGLSFRIGVGPVREEMPARAVYAPNGVVATSQPLASQAGLTVLNNGGNAVDAAVTAAAVLSVVEPYMTGIGGDMFAILWSAEKQTLIGINGSGRSGARMPEDAAKWGVGAKSVTVPGALSGWAALLEQYGTISLAEALAPAIKLAEQGFQVSAVTASEWGAFADTLTYTEAGKATFLVDGERAPRVGEWFSNPDYAETLRTIAREGPQVLYGGALGKTIAEHLQPLGGYLTLEDFSNHREQWVEPLSVPFKDYRLWELPPNGQGIAALEMLRILESYDLAAMGHNSAPYLHLLNMILFEMDVQQALDAPRFRHWSGKTVGFEKAIPQSVVDQLASMGHSPRNTLIEMTEIIEVGPNRGLIFGGGQAIMKTQRGYIAGSDSRRDGLAAAH